VWVVGKEDFILGRAGLISISHSNILPKSDLFRLFFFSEKVSTTIAKFVLKKITEGEIEKRGGGEC